jgi:two-component system phosphate regulon sensor histidine kinase PhoR
MKKMKWLTMLMGITLLVITCFQAYWLRNNYKDEKRSLQIQTNLHFQETMKRMQVAKLKLKFIPRDSTKKGPAKIIINEELPHRGGETRVVPDEEFVVDVMKDKLRDSLNYRRLNSTVVVSMDRKNAIYRGDSFPGKFEKMNGDIVQFLYGVDSLQDSLKIPEITKAYAKTLAEQKLDVPFAVTRTDTVLLHDGKPDMSAVIVGFAHPITYRLELGNVFPYVIKKITLPILFSIFLVGVSILSFLLLYRNLLRQQRLAEIKNEFISNITHELKTPIATVGVAIEALKNFNAIHDPQRTKEYLDISSNELQRLSLLVDKVLKLSMFEKKEIDLKYESLDLKDVVNEVVNSMRLQIEKYHAKVSVSEEGDVHMQGDRLHLLSVVFNLLDNALKYSKGEPSIHIELKEKEQNIEMSIADNGIGISPEYRNKVFEKFFRVPTGNTHNAKGYGLGLSYVAYVIQKHKGEITVESKEGIGTKFIITLPKDHA